jgi:hypothetical protein
MGQWRLIWGGDLFLYNKNQTPIIMADFQINKTVMAVFHTRMFTMTCIQLTPEET